MAPKNNEQQLKTKLASRPSDPGANIQLVRLYCESRSPRLDHAFQHCVSVEEQGLLRHSLEWHTVRLGVLQAYLKHKAVSGNRKLSCRVQIQVLLALCDRLRLSLAQKGAAASEEALIALDKALRDLLLQPGALLGRQELEDVFSEMRAQLYLHSATFLLKEAQGEWSGVCSAAALCYLLAYQAQTKPKARGGDRALYQRLEILAVDRKSQVGHMLFNLVATAATESVGSLVNSVLETYSKTPETSEKADHVLPDLARLFKELFKDRVDKSTSFLANDEKASLQRCSPELSHLAQVDERSVVLHGAELQQLSWLALQWSTLSLEGQGGGASTLIGGWMKRLFPRLPLENTGATGESVCLLDLEVFVHGVAFCAESSSAELQLCSPSDLHPSARCTEWWDAAKSLLLDRRQSHKLQEVVRRGLVALRAEEGHGLQPALLVRWARHLGRQASTSTSSSDEYSGRSECYWKAAVPLLEDIAADTPKPAPHPSLLFEDFTSTEILSSAARELLCEAKEILKTGPEVFPQELAEDGKDQGPSPDLAEEIQERTESPSRPVQEPSPEAPEEIGERTSEQPRGGIFGTFKRLWNKIVQCFSGGRHEDNEERDGVNVSVVEEESNNATGHRVSDDQEEPGDADGRGGDNEGEPDDPEVRGTGETPSGTEENAASSLLWLLVPAVLCVGIGVVGYCCWRRRPFAVLSF